MVEAVHGSTTQKTAIFILWLCWRLEDEEVEGKVKVDVMDMRREDVQFLNRVRILRFERQLSAVLNLQGLLL
jgi:hypothetical protein